MGRREANSYGTLNPYVIDPTLIETDDLYGYKIIAIIYNDPFWCCYMGLTDWDDIHIAMHGDKVPKEIAEKLFSTLAIGKIYNE